MDIIEEYKLQQSWRNWNQYLEEVPLHETDRLIDLGCSVGGVSNILSKQVASVIGIDLSNDFINYCQSVKQPNQTFICSDFTKVNYDLFLPITGIWSSFSISYLKKADEFLKSLYKVLQPGGWIALVDVSCFISGNMLPGSKLCNAVRKFEIASCKSGIYDFNFGSKQKTLLKQIGFTITHVNNDVTDAELNFNGMASPQILQNWNARLERTQGLRNEFPKLYPEICEEVITSLKSKEHCKRNNVQFVVATKSK